VAIEKFGYPGSRDVDRCVPPVRTCLEESVSRAAVPIALCLVLGLAASCGGGGNRFDGGTSPVISSIEPTSGGSAGGTAVVIRGANLANTAPGTFEVTFGGQPAAQIVVIDSTEVECRTPPGTPGAADVQIVNRFGSSLAPAAFVYHPTPVVTSISPDRGTREGGTPVTVTGSGFADNDPGETVCLIGLKTLLDIDIVNDTTITGVTQDSWIETSKDVTVTNNNGVGLLPGAYRYVGPPPEITSVTPNEGSRAGGETLTITGIEFTGDLTVYLGEKEAFNVFSPDDVTITCVTPPNPVAGPVDVRVTNFNGEDTFTDGFTYLPNPVPASIDPTEGTVSGGTHVDIYGTDFSGGGAVTVLFGSVPATNVTVHDDTHLSCDTPAGSAIGPTTVTVQNSYGEGMVPGGFEYLAPEFWWEETYGTFLSSATGWSSYQAVALPFSFPFYDSSYSSAYALPSGQLHFGSVTTGQFSIDIIQTHPHIAPLAGLLYVDGSSARVYQTDHVPGRTIFTWDSVPEYTTLGSNSFQLHLLETGTWAVVYGSTTYNLQTTNYGVSIMCGVSRGTNLGASEVVVDWTSGTLSSAANEAFVQRWGNGQTGDLDDGVLTFTPNEDGGFDSTWTPGVPEDPDP